MQRILTSIAFKGRGVTSVRSAFSIVELLVVIAIIGIIVSLLLPAVQSARETARQTHCRNNLRQLALAAFAFHDARQTFPPARIAKQHPSWLYLILPYLDFGALQWDGACRRSMYEMPLAQRCVVVPQYICPTRSRDSAVVTLGADFVNFFPRRLKYMGSVSDYGACRGARAPGVTYLHRNPLLETGVMVHAIYTEFPDVVQRPTAWKGLISIAMIEDGTSHTILAGELGERRANSRHAFNGDKTGGEWLGVLNPPAIDDDDSGFGSNHVGVIGFAFCDGSVRPIAIETDIHLLEALATRAGGELTAP